MKIKRIGLFVLFIILILIIFVFSNQNGVKSEATSDKFTSKVVDVVGSVSKKEIKNKDKIIINARFMVRKLAHFTLYFMLGIIAYLLLNTFIDKKVILISIILCLMFAIADEIHQLFLDGRTAKVYDVLIDTVGSSSAIYLTYFIRKIINKKKLKLVNT